ncbi:hypothetical protein L914_10007 [Phytophthora nicotianae]|uniref:Secreted protein n=1 Tax=Phytophthora nicotianae TaxID=4792 RepID=W2N885_PHYNI|nr:hypothetical protein L914_10007 [Phytophthora nicotianae]
MSPRPRSGLCLPTILATEAIAALPMAPWASDSHYQAPYLLRSVERLPRPRVVPVKRPLRCVSSQFQTWEAFEAYLSFQACTHELFFSPSIAVVYCDGDGDATLPAGTAGPLASVLIESNSATGDADNQSANLVSSRANLDFSWESL